MGMFDTIYCDLDLPDGFNQDHNRSFQSKYLECLLDDYRINEDRKLVLEREFDGERAVSPNKHIDFHGMLRFYTYDGDINSNDYIWHEYNAKFTDGECVDILLVESRVGPIKARENVD